MNKWILGARPRTLPAAIGPVLVGTALIRTTHHSINWLNAVMALAVSLFLQIAVNFSNDYSDGVRGTDGDRVGPTRLVASGLASPSSVKNAAIITYGLAALIGLELSYRTSLWLVLIGAFSIAAAWGYTGGTNPYGYRGFGELSVFVFFGLAATIGSYFVQSEKVSWASIALAIPMGCLSCAILSVNNLRDRPKDEVAGKLTVAVRVGDKRARFILVSLLITAHIFSASLAWVTPWALLTLALLPLSLLITREVFSGVSGAGLIPLLGKIARLQMLFSLVLALALSI
jgi:1,4-dihydroxy-2-naphthoate octaprenyltransferase